MDESNVTDMAVSRSGLQISNRKCDLININVTVNPLQVDKEVGL